MRGNSWSTPVAAKEIHAPQIIQWKFFTFWAFRCGSCERDVVKFALFGRPRCPFCRNFNYMPYTIYY